MQLDSLPIFHVSFSGNGNTEIGSTHSEIGISTDAGFELSDFESSDFLGYLEVSVPSVTWVVKPPVDHIQSWINLDCMSPSYAQVSYKLLMGVCV